MADQSQVTLNNNAQTDNSVTASETNKATTNQQPVGGVATKSTDATDTPAATTNNEKVAANEATAQKTTPASQGQSTNADQNQNSLDGMRQVLQNISNTASYRNNINNVASLVGASFIATPTSEATTDNNSVTVSDAKGLIDAIQNGTATTINVGADIDLGEKTNSNYTNTNISNKRNITIQSADGKHYTVDFNSYGFNMYSNDYGVTFKDLDLYGRSYYGIVRSAGSYTFDNVNYTGSQLIYTDSGYNTTVNFDGNVTAHSVGSYTSPLNNKSQSSQGGNTQQVIQFAAGTNTINFNSGSNVTLTTTNSNVLEVDRGKTTINVKNGAQVSLNPHTQNGPEQINGMNMDGIARGIASKGDTTLNIDQGGNLDINLTKNTEDKYLSSALYLNSGATINVNGNLNINSDGTPYYRYQGWDDPVYINGNAAINVNGGSFKVNATNMGDYKGSVVTSNGNSTIAISHHGTFDVTGDGTQATGVSLGSGSTFTSTQPELFDISMPDGATAIKNGKVQFKGVKTSADGQPIGEINIIYASDGTPTVTKVTSYDEATTTATRTAGNKAKNKIKLVAAGEEVNLSDVKFIKNADGTYTMSGDANTVDNKGAYVYISVNGQVHQVSPTDSQTLWTAGETGDPTSSQVPYTAETGADGKFTVNLGKLKDTDQVSVYGAKDFVTSDTDTKTVSGWMTDSYKTELQNLVNEAPTVKTSTNFTSAGTDEQKAYTDAIANGQNVLDNSAATSDQIQSAITTITEAKSGLNGEINSAKQALQDAVNKAPAIEKTAAYYNTNSAKQTAYTDAITAGSDALKAPNPTVKSLTDALTAINTAKSALDGQATNKTALETAVKNSDTVKASNNYTNADKAQKTAYDNAVTNAKSVLDNTDATQAQVNQALQKLEEANSKLNGDTKTDAANKAALEVAVKDAPNVRNTPAYYNGSKEAQTTYNNAINAGQAVLNETNPSASGVKNALDTINAAKDNLKGEATSTEVLKTALTNANDAKETGNYTNADQANQKALNNAITAGQDLLKNTNATQAQVDSAAKAITDAINGLNGDTNLTNAKKVATEDIQKALDAKTTEITDATNIDQATKDQLIADAKKAAEDANTAINQATDANAVNTAKTEGITKINNVKIPSLDGAKQAANQAIDQALDTKTKEINAANNIDQATKDQLIKEATAAANTAKDAIKKATTNDAATKAGQAGVDAIKKIVPTSLDTVKSDADKAIDDALTKKLEEINSASDLTTDEKTALTQEANTAADKAKKEITNATTNDAVIEAQNNGVTAIDGIKVPTESAVKEAAKKAVAEAATAKNNAIDASNLTDEEKATLKQKVTEAQTAADQAIDNATSNAAVTEAQTNGVTAINGIKVPTESTAKEAAKKAVADAATAKNKAIDSSNLTAEEKAALKQKVTEAQNAADQAIDNATSNAAVTEAQNSGVNAIDGIKVPTESAVKEAAKKAVADAATAKNTAIDSSNLTDEEKAALKQKVTEAQTAADQAIDRATTNAAVTKAQTNGVNAIDGIKVPTESAVKQAAKEAVANAANEKNAAIDSSNLTAEEKAALKQKVTDAQNAADQAIDNATTNAAVTEAQNSGVNAINGIEVPTKSDVKDQATTDLNTAVDEAKKAIDQDNNLTDAEKQAAKDQIDSDAKTAQDAINNAKTNDDVKKAAADGTLAIDKDVANAALDNAVAGKKAEIAKAPLTDEEKTALNNEVDQKAQDAKEAINNATTPEAVTTAQENGIKNINDIDVPTESAAKQAAKEAVANAANEKNAAIDSSNLTAEEKAALKQDVTEAQNAANTAIDNATTNADVTEAKDNGISAIDGIKVPTTSANKEKAITDLNNEVENAKKAIDQDSNLTDEQKQAAKDQIDSDAKTAQDAIDNAKTDDEVNTAVDNGQLSIDKDVANAAIDNAVAGKKAEISNSPLTDEEKTALNNEVDQKTNTAKKAINAATTPETVTSAQDNGIKNINETSVPTQSAAKEAAKKAVAEAAEAKNNAIDSSNLTDEEKATLKQKVTDAQNAADQAIDNATTNAAVTEAQTNGVNTINGIEVPTQSDAKDQATAELNTAVENAKKAIDQDSNLTDEQKQAAKDQIDSDAKTAQEAINNAKTNDDVKKAADNGTLAIDKDVANAAIDNALAGKKSEISNSSLTDEEKATLNNEVDQKANIAKDAINTATTPEAVTTSQDKGIKDINKTSVPTESAAKQAAKEAVAKAADEKNAAIDASNLTDEEKATLKQKVTEAQNAADQAIDNATTNAAVTEAKDNGVTAIDHIKVPTTSANKEKAITDLNTAVDEAKEAIDQDSNLTDEEKQAAKDQIDSDAKTAQDAINNAKTNDDVKKAAADGTLAIDKDVANAAIDNAVAGKKSEISNLPLTDEEKTALNNEVDQKAQDAKEAINAATTPEAVTSAQDNGIKNINDTEVPSESATKQAAKEAVAKAVDEKNAAIDSSNLTAEEKAALKQKVTEVQNAADQAIDNATTNAAVTEAKNNGVSAIDHIKVPTTSANKEKAITDLNNEVEKAKQAIDQDSNLTDEEKQAVKSQIDTEAKTAQDAINSAKTDNEVNNAVNSGKVSIDKDVANAAIDNAVAGKLKEIQDPLTTDEKQAYTDLINSEANNAKQNIANATTVEEVTTAQNSGVDAINKIEVPTTSTVKDDAIKAIDKALQNKTDEINNASNINPQEKTDLINQATEAANVAKNNINNATTNADVDTAQTNGEKAIADVTVPNLSDVKKESIDLVNKALDAKTAEINNASNLSQDEKQSLINDATNAATEAINNINESQTNDDAKAAATTGVQNIENVTIPTLDDAKKNANQAIDDALNSKVNEINNASNLNDTEKQKLVDQATEVATTAKNNVENATTNDAARDAANAGIDNIKGIRFTSLEDAKKVANTAIDNALQVKTDEINNASNLSTEEKQDLINQASEAAKNAKDNINNATTNDAVTDAQNKGIADIANVTVPSLAQAKQDAINAIKQVQDAKNKQISAASNLSAKEQKELSDQVDKIANDAIAKINDAATTTNDAVTAIRDDAIKQITDLFIPTLDGAQTDALNAIESAKNAKLNDINNAVHLTDQEKQALVDQANKAADEATKAINAAQTNDEVKSAETAGLDIINNITIPTLVQKQQEAIEELNAARDAKNSAIDNAADLTTDEKNALKDKVQAEYSNAVSNITSATTDEAVTAAKENGIAAIKDIQIPTMSAAKEQATTDLKTAVDDAKKAIDQDSNLTDEEKQAAKDQIDSDAKKAQEAIDNAKTDDEVKTAVDNGQLAIDKDVANAAIDNAVAGKKAEIAKAPLTTDEANALNDLVDQEAKAAKKAIDSATTIPAVEDAKNTGVAAINDIAVPTTSSTKDQANQTIDDALANKIKEINDATNLSDKQKQDLIDQANEEAAKAKENIKNATSNEAVNKATTDGVDAIANVTVPSLDDAKKDASQVIDDVLKQKEDEINNASHLTEQEKQDLINQAQNAANEAKDKINQATTNDDVATERDTGAEKIANIVVPSLEDAKDKATKAIDDALADKTKEINDQTHLSDQEKNDLIKQITDIADKAKDKINNDSNDAEVAKDEKDGIDAIVDTKVPGLEDRKQNAIKTLDEAKSTKLAQIDEATHLTADEKANLTQQVDAEYNKALDNINKATTNDDADKASADGVEAILNIAVPSLNEKKQDSIDALNEVRDAKKEEINNANNLNQDEKDELTKQVDQIADNAINAINGAKDDQTAKNAENKGIQDILDVKVPSLDEVKTNAKQAIADALESKTNEINAASNLDSATKQELINRANAEADTAIEKIDQATSNDQALAASQAGIDKILGIEVPTLADAKQSAIDAINDALKQKEAEINNASQLTSDEKQNLINQVNSIADNAKNAINNATTNQSVEETKNAGIEKINAINVPTISATKDEAIKAIDDALTNKVNEINNATNITADEKANLIDEANNAANTAKDNITKATSDSEVATATTDGIDAIANVTVPSLETAKDQAKNMIDDVLNEKKNEINNAQNLSDSQKQDLINQATDEADQAKKNIDNATTNNDVQTAEDNGAQAIENVTVPSLDDAKKASTKVIDEVLKEKTAEINAATNLSNTEKDALIKDATTAANTAKDNIAKATTNDAVKDAETDGVKAILDIKVPGREDQQKDAIAALDRALADKVSEIDNANNLSETTKQDLKQQAQAAYTTAVDNVNNAQTSAEINAARDNGVQAILDITVPTLTDAQDASITAVEQVRDAKKTQIEAAKNLTETQKEALKNQVDEIADKAIDNIKNATTDATVKDAETAGINEILNVTIPTLDAAKSDAKQAIADALTAKTAEINAAQNLTDAEKQKLIDQAQTEAAAANKNIDAATTNDAAELAAKNGVQAILDIQVPTVEETRDQAKKNVDNALNSKKEEINNSNLSPAAKEALINEAEQAAENARTAIDNATTASAIGEAEAAGIAAIENIKVSNASTESDNSSNHQTNTETPTEGNSASQDNNNATQAPVQGNNTQADLTGSHGTNLTIGQQTEKAADTNSKETLPQTGNETERGLSIAGLAIASLLGLFGLSGLGKKRD